MFKRIFLTCIFFVATTFCGENATKTLDTDSLLGKPFLMQQFVANGHLATFIASRINTGEVVAKPKTAILYIHGFNDYFFQKELAQKLNEAGFAFYAIDLHNYGRSYIDSTQMGKLRDISEYYRELDSAVAYIKKLEGDSVKIALLGHSTGGLVASLYAADRSGFFALILNSPFLEFNYMWPLRHIAVPLISFAGKYFPNIAIPASRNNNYGKSVYRGEYGEWNFDTTLKKIDGLPVDFGWVRAIHLGHLRVQQGLNLKIPVLVMHSCCSYRKKEWSSEYTYCDGVLNVDDIRNYGAHLGKSVQLEQIDGSLHDLYLSSKLVRERAYNITIDFLNSKIK